MTVLLATAPLRIGAGQGLGGLEGWAVAGLAVLALGGLAAWVSGRRR